MVVILVLFSYVGLLVGVFVGGEYCCLVVICLVIWEVLQQGVIIVQSFDVFSGGVVLVGGGFGDFELIMVCGCWLFVQVDVVVVDWFVLFELLVELLLYVEVIDVVKIFYGWVMVQDVINVVLIEWVRFGNFVVCFKGGDFFVFVWGYEEVLVCVYVGILVIVVLGVMSVIVVFVMVGVLVIYWVMIYEFVVVSGYFVFGYFELLVNWDVLVVLMGIIVLLMVVECIEFFVDVLLKGG